MKWLLIIIATLFIAGCTQEPQYINRQFKNGKSINVEVSDKITTENWDCTGDCSGHWAGYDWAESKGITEPEDCGGNSVSFIEGCEAYANDN